MFQVGPAREVLAPFANSLIFLFLGSFILARALFVHRVNERISHGVLLLSFVGALPTRILLAWGTLAAFLSAWMSDTATTAMLVPIGMSLVVFLETEGNLPKRYGTALMLMTAYGAVIGGMATPVGTPPNIIAMGMLDGSSGCGSPWWSGCWRGCRPPACSGAAPAPAHQAVRALPAAVLHDHDPPRLSRLQALGETSNVGRSGLQR